MPENYAPFREIYNIDDLLLIDTPLSTGQSITIDDAYYPELCLWVTLQCDELDLFSENGQTLVDGVTKEGFGWRLSITSRGYLRFEDKNPDDEDRQSVDSHLPVHAVVNTKGSFRLGFSLEGTAWAMRDTRYAGGGPSSVARLRLFAVSGPGQRITEIGGKSGIDRVDMNPVPRTLVGGQDADGQHRLAGNIERITAYNTSRLEHFDAMEREAADDTMPLIPCGSAFAPRWVDDETIEVFTRPEFTGTTSYWVHLTLEKLPEKCRRMRIGTKWYGGVNMTPTFFWSPNGDNWSRVVPARCWMGDERTNFRVEFHIDDLPRKGGYLASCPPFLETHREELLQWARGQENITVTKIGESVLGRAIHAISVGGPGDGPARHGVAITCGQHSPLEIMGGRVIRPVIENLLDRPELLADCAFHFVPTVNVDCQHFGGNGLNANRRNNNRHWMVNIQPENQACVDYFDGLKDAGQPIDFAMDIHAGGIFRNHVLMHMADSDAVSLSQEDMDAQEQWRDLLQKHAGLRREDCSSLQQLDLRATDYFHQAHGATAFCLELSTCSFYDPLINHTRAFAQDAFGILADGLAEAWAEMFLRA